MSRNGGAAGNRGLIAIVKRDFLVRPRESVLNVAIFKNLRRQVLMEQPAELLRPVCSPTKDVPAETGWDALTGERELTARVGDDLESVGSVAGNPFGGHGSGSVAARQSTTTGFQIHIPKPVNLHELTAVIARLGGRSE
jgi:hypothetical protein